MFSASENVQNDMWTQVSKSFEKTLDLTYFIFLSPGISIQYRNKKHSRVNEQDSKCAQSQASFRLHPPRHGALSAGTRDDATPAAAACLGRQQLVRVKGKPSLMHPLQCRTTSKSWWIST